MLNLVQSKIFNNNFNNLLKNLKKKLPKEILHFFQLSITSITTQFVRLFTGIFNARLLTPYLYATNTSVSTFVRYLTYSHLGAQNGLNRQLPIEIGKNDQEKFKLYLDSTFSFLILINVIILFCFMILKTSGYSYYDIIPNSYFLDIYLLTSASLFYQFFYSYLVSTSQFKLISELRMKFDITGSILSVGAVYFFSLHGLFITQVIILFTQIVIIIIKVEYNVKFRFSLKHQYELIKVGAFILFASLGVYFFSTLDFIYVSSLFSKKNVGLYGFAITLVGFFKIYATSLSDILAPKIGKHFGENKEQTSSLAVFVTDYVFLFIIIIFLFGAIFFFMVPLIVKFFLPDYLGSINIFQNLILAAIAMMVYIPAGHVITVLNKLKNFIILIIFFALVFIGSIKFYPSSKLSLEKISFLAMILSYMVSVSIIIFSNYIVFKNKFPSKKVIKYLTLMMFLLFFLLMLKNNFIGNAFWQVILFTILKLVFFLFILFIVFYYFDKKNKLIVKLKAVLINFIK